MENRNNNCKNTTENKRSASTNSTQNGTEHKHPNQYTKGADDENAKDCGKNSAKNCR